MSEDFWNILLDAIEKGGVIPVVGGDLLRVVGCDGIERQFSQCIAETLAVGLGTNNAPVDLQGLLAAELRSGREEDELVREMAAAHRRALEQADPPEALRLLAGITDFSLFLSTTTDGLLARAISQERGLAPAVGAAKIFDSIDLAPELAWASGAVAPPRQPAIYHFFGRIEPEPTFALNEEDLLEFLFHLQDPDRRPKRLFDRLMQSHVLLIGNSFPDWLARFVVRMLRGRRLSERATTRLALADECTRGRQDAALVLFLKRFSRLTTIFEEGGAREFVAELHRRWMARQVAAGPKASATERYEAEEMVEGAIFISYAREDGAAAQALHEGLASAKFDVWFDRRRLKGGDPFEDKIARHIRQCDLFVPIVSEHTNSRGEGFVFKEWNWALERAAGIQHGNFIFPVIVDDLSDDQIAGVAEKFRKMDYRHAPEGAPNQDLVESFRQNIREIRLQRPRRTA
jgi:hypothetical protein